MDRPQGIRRRQEIRGRLPVALMLVQSRRIGTAARTARRCHTRTPRDTARVGASTAAADSAPARELATSTDAAAPASASLNACRSAAELLPK